MGKRGRKPKPTLLKMRAGNPGRRPLGNEPQPKLRAPPCPRFLGKTARAEWRRVCPELIEQGILTNLDRAVLVAYCDAWALYVEAHAKVAEFGSVIARLGSGRLTDSPYYRQMIAAEKAMVSFAAELGMTPSARSRVQVQPRPATSDKTRHFRIAPGAG